MSGIRIISLKSLPSGLPVCARWNYEQWGRKAGRSLGGTLADLERIANSKNGEHAIMAMVGDQPAGMALLIQCDLETHRHLKPWVAGTYTAPEFRSRGVASELLGNLEGLARNDGAEAIYLYTAIPKLYERLAWVVLEQLHFDNAEMVVMKRQL